VLERTLSLVQVRRADENPDEAAQGWLMHCVCRNPSDEPARQRRVRGDPSVRVVARIRFQLPTTRPKAAMFRTMALCLKQSRHE